MASSRKTWSGRNKLDNHCGQITLSIKDIEDVLTGIYAANVEGLLSNELHGKFLDVIRAGIKPNV